MFRCCCGLLASSCSRLRTIFTSRSLSASGLLVCAVDSSGVLSSLDSYVELELLEFRLSLSLLATSNARDASWCLFVLNLRSFGFAIHPVPELRKFEMPQRSCSYCLLRMPSTETSRSPPTISLIASNYAPSSLRRRWHEANVIVSVLPLDASSSHLFHLRSTFPLPFFTRNVNVSAAYLLARGTAPNLTGSGGSTYATIPRRLYDDRLDDDDSSPPLAVHV